MCERERGPPDNATKAWCKIARSLFDNFSPPSIVTSSPNTVRAAQEATVELFCRATGTPIPDVVWSKDNTPLANTNRLTIALNKETVSITNLQRSDGGEYGCTFQNTVGQVSKKINLIVQGAAYILNKPSNMTVVKGQRVTFTCGAYAFPNNLTYSWYFGGTNVRNLPGYNSRITTQMDPASNDEQLIEHLIISPVYEGDMGWYTCKPTNGVGEDPEASAFLNVTYEPVVLVDLMESQVTWALGFRQRLDCPVDANPPVHEVSWTKNSYVVDFSSSRLTQLSNGSLLVYQVQQVDAGSYSCTPISSVGSGKSSPLVQVIVQDPPRFIIRPEPRYVKRSGDEVTMVCAAAGKPKPEILWRKVTGKLNFSGRILLNEGNLTITSLNKVDHGKYECEASNDFATIVVVTELIIQDTTPHAPYNITTIPDWFSVRLSWIPAYNGGSKALFLIWYRSRNGQTSEWLTMQVIPQDATHFTVYRLQPDTIYEFKIMARNVNGDGNFSDVVVVKTLGTGAPLPTALPTDASGSMYYPTINKSYGPRPPPPRNVSAAIITGGIRIGWLPPFPTSIQLKSGGFFLSQAEIGGIIGGLLFLLVAVLLAIIGVICSKRRDKRTEKYGNVKYLGPADEVDSMPNYRMEDSAEWGGRDTSGGTDALRQDFIANGIFLVPQTKKSNGDLDMMHHDYLAESQLYPPNDYIYNSDKGYRVPYGGGHDSYDPLLKDDDFMPRSYDRSRSYDLSRSYDRSRSHDRSRSRTSGYTNSFHSEKDNLLGSGRSRFPEQSYMSGASSVRRRDTSHDGYRDRSPNNGYHGYGSDRHGYHNNYSDHHPYVNQSFPRSSSSSKPSFHSDVNPKDFLPPRPPIGDKANGFLPERYNHLSMPKQEKNENYDDENGFVPTRPPLPVEYRDSSLPYSPGQQDRTTPFFHGLERPNYGPMGHKEPSYENIPADLDDVFVPSFDHHSPSHHHRPGFPRHSSMKPSYQTYLTGDPEEEDSSTQPFVAKDISSVLPSFTESSIQPYPSYYEDEPTLVNRLEKPKWNIPFDSLRGDQVAPDYQRNSRPQSRSNDLRPRSRSSDSRPQSRFGSLNNTVRERPSSSNGSTLEKLPSYTRDHLQGTVDKIRKGPRARRAKSAGRLPSSEYNGDIPAQVVPRGPHVSDSDVGYGRYGNDGGVHPDNYSNDVEPYKSKRDSRSSVNSSGRGSMAGRSRHVTEPGKPPYLDLTPDSLSSGLGSRNNSHVTGSSGNSRIPYARKSASVDSMGNPLDPDISEDSSPFLDNSARKDTSADDQYEFDSLQALENDLINTLREHPISSQDDELLHAIQTGLSTSDFYDDLYPKPSRQSRYEDSDARFERLREEFHHFQRLQQERHHQVRLAMDSDML
ncbi:hypothetical protein FSP39_003286 [Pinctada imbricata]|uniref:Uncharacterized protein n=1 Tax=Pinctada imbricata TaxID=66713 RepID=A0AA88YRH0_PINIB|nr:hypothetical protein FSP39_003286 [Pinctada imbricata]